MALCVDGWLDQTTVLKCVDRCKNEQEKRKAWLTKTLKETPDADSSYLDSVLRDAGPREAHAPPLARKPSTAQAVALSDHRSALLTHCRALHVTKATDRRGGIRLCQRADALTVQQ